MAPVIKTLFI